LLHSTPKSKLPDKNTKNTISAMRSRSQPS
jgi:hypothetical protein